MTICLNTLSVSVLLIVFMGVNKTKLTSGGEVVEVKVKFRSTKILLIVVIFTVLIVLIFGCVFFVRSHQKAKTETKKQINAYVSTADNSIIKGDLKNAIADYDKAIDKSTSNRQKADIALKKSAMCNNSGVASGNECMLKALDQYDSLVGADYRSLIPRGFYLMNSGKRDDAKKLFDKAIDELNSKPTLSIEEQGYLENAKLYRRGL